VYDCGLSGSLFGDKDSLKGIFFIIDVHVNKAYNKFVYVHFHILYNEML